MAVSVKVVCECCKKTFSARHADVNRGWGKFCSKSCKAKKQETRTGQYANLIHRDRLHIRGIDVCHRSGPHIFEPHQDDEEDDRTMSPGRIGHGWLW